MPGQVLHGGDLICEGFARPLKVAPKAADAVAAPPAAADGAPTEAADAALAAPAAEGAADKVYQPPESDRRRRGVSGWT